MSSAPLLDDLPVREAIDVDGIPAQRSPGRGDAKEIPLLGRLDREANRDRVPRRDDVLLGRMQVGERADETAQQPQNVLAPLHCAEGAAVPLTSGAT